VYGLNACLLGGFVYAVLGGNCAISVGPTALVSLLLSSVLDPNDTEVDPSLRLALVTFFVGAFQLLLGFFKLGFLLEVLTHPVVSGFTTASALTISSSQIPALLGLPKLPSSSPWAGRRSFVYEVGAAISRITDANPYAIALSAGCLALLILGGLVPYVRMARYALVVIIATLVVGLAHLDVLPQHPIKVVGEVPKGLSPLLPAFPEDPADLLKIIGAVISIALVSITEVIALSRKYGMLLQYSQSVILIAPADPCLAEKKMKQT
jgi:SulP family sulfate permease